MKKITFEEFKRPTEDILVNDWLNFLNMPGPVDCGEYTMRQKLNKDQAKEIMHKVANACGFNLIWRGWKRNNMYYRLFISTYICLLCSAGADNFNKWYEMLWNALPRVDQKEITRETKRMWEFV